MICVMNPDDGPCEREAALGVVFKNDDFKEVNPVCAACAEREAPMVERTVPL